MMKKILFIVLTIILFTSTSVGVFADETAGNDDNTEIIETDSVDDRMFLEEQSIVASGKCGANAKWSLSDKGVLTVSGTGDLYDFQDADFNCIRTPPWGKYYRKIVEVIIEDGITGIGSAAFNPYYDNGLNSIDSVLKKVTMPNSVKKIGHSAFAWCDLVIQGVSGSYAQRYAEENDIPFSMAYYSDVPENHPYFDAVMWAKKNGIAAGYSGEREGEFGVGDYVTRGQVVMFLWRASGKPEPWKKKQTFSDVPVSHSFYNAIQWAYEAGITAGYDDGRFGVNDKCTRGQIAMFLWRFSGEPEPISPLQRFRDVYPKHGFYKAIQWASDAGITSGYSDNSFGVNRTCTRGHCVTFLYRLLK